MFKSLIITLSIIAMIFISTLQAEETEKPLPDPIVNQSEVHRQNNQFNVSFTPPLPPGYLFLCFSVGGHIEYFINENIHIGISAHTGGVIMGRFSFREQMITYRHFLGNSFNYKLGLGMSEVYLSKRWDEGSYQKQGVLHFSIGNRWYWDTFNHGINWIGGSLYLNNPMLFVPQIMHYSLGISF